MLTNNNIKIILKIFIFIVFNTNIWFAEKEFMWRNYIATKILSTTKKVELIDKQKFIVVALNKSKNNFILYVTSL